jgi:hypothetical protein
MLNEFAIMKNLFRWNSVKILGLILVLSAVLLTCEILAVLLNLPEHNLMRGF